MKKKVTHALANTRLIGLSNGLDAAEENATQFVAPQAITKKASGGYVTPLGEYN